MKIFVPLFAVWLAIRGVIAAYGADFTLQIDQVTNGPKHHFFGYIGHVKTILWNRSGRYIVALQTDFQDRMPTPADAADIVLIDTQRNYEMVIVDRTHAWNPQQGTMLYWNPLQPESQFFFNDRDPVTHEVFCVLYDVDSRKRMTEYRFHDTPVGNSGVAQNGGWFLGINYGRMARLRPVTGYPEAADWTVGTMQPEDDGVFKVNSATKEKQLLISFEQLAEALAPTHPEVNGKHLFINHTLWSRDDSRIFFFVRGDFDKPNRCNIGCVMNPDGTGLQPLTSFIGGHPEWESGHRMIGRVGPDQIIYDVDQQRVVDKLGTPDIFPEPEGDIALSPDGNWFVNGHGDQGKNFYSVLHRPSGRWARSPGVKQGGYIRGDLRLDPGPLWNRNSNQLLVPGIADDTAQTRQLFVITIKEENTDKPVR